MGAIGVLWSHRNQFGSMKSYTEPIGSFGSIVKQRESVEAICLAVKSQWELYIAIGTQRKIQVII